MRDILKEKHPERQAPHPDTLLPEDPRANIDSHPVLFEQLNGDLIRATALRTQGSAGPSAIDANGWRRLCTSASSNLCNALAAVARRLCTEEVDHKGLKAFVACRLIPLDKRPGVRPIGVCEVSRRIISKAILNTISSDIQQAAGTLQLCAGQPAGIEASHPCHVSAI